MHNGKIWQDKWIRHKKLKTWHPHVFSDRSLSLSLRRKKINYLAKFPTHDATNSFKLYRTSFLRQQKIESTGGFELGMELVVKAYLQGFKVLETPTVWTDRQAGKSNFKIIEWLPSYLKWYFMAFKKLKWKIN